MSNSILSLIEFIAALSVLLLIHEMGHFLVGKLFKVEAEVFGFGSRPRYSNSLQQAAPISP